MKTIFVVLIALVLVVPAQKKDKREWQEGTLTDITAKRDAWGHIAYTIDTGEMVYTAGHFHFRGSDKPLPLTINTKVKFAIEKEKFYLVDDEGKEHKLKLEKKALKTPSASPAEAAPPIR